MQNRPSKSSLAELKRYDSELGARYSWEKKRWAITRKVMPLLRSHLPLPVKRMPRMGGGFDEVLKPELSEAYLNWKNKTVVIGYVRDLTKETIREVFRMDGWRKGNSIHGRIAGVEAGIEKRQQYEKKQRVGAAYDFLRSGIRRNIMSY